MPPAAIAASWYASLAAHEAGHAAAAALTRAHTIRVHLPLLGFSRTDITGDQHPLLTTASGFVVGTSIPLAIRLGAIAIRLPGRSILAFWSGFALVLNGAYLAGDALLQTADGATLARAGATPWLTVPTGIMLTAAGLRVWHTLGAPTPRPDHQTRAPVIVAIALLASAITLTVAF